MVRRHRERPAGRRLGCDHPECLRERARHDLRLGERQQRRQLGVFEAAGQDHALGQRAGGAQVGIVDRVEEGEQVAQRGARTALGRAPLLRQRSHGAEVARGQCREQPLEGRAVGPEADDHEPRSGLPGQHERPRRDEHVDALGDDQLADEDDVAILPTQAAQRRRGGARVAAERGLDRAGRLVLELVGEHRHARRRVGQRAKLRDVDARRAQARPLRQLVVAHRGPEALRGVARADEHGARRREPLARVGQEALRVALDDVLERTTVDLHGVGHRIAERPREHDRSHHQVVCQRHVGRLDRANRAHRVDVAGQVRLELGVGDLEVRARLHALVAVGHVDRQQTADVGLPGGHADGFAEHFEPIRMPDRVDELQGFCVRLLRKQRDLVALLRESCAKSRVVDVGARSPQ